LDKYSHAVAQEETNSLLVLFTPFHNLHSFQSNTPPITKSFNMAMSQAAWKAEQALGHGDNANTAQDVTNPGLKPEWGNPNETMKALAWMGKNKVEVGK